MFSQGCVKNTHSNLARTVLSARVATFCHSLVNTSWTCLKHMPHACSISFA